MIDFNKNMYDTQNGPNSRSSDDVRNKIKSAIMIIAAIGETIQKMGSVPSGYLYAMVYGKLSLDQYNTIIGALVKHKLIENRNHLLVWIGPKMDDKGASNAEKTG